MSRVVFVTLLFWAGCSVEPGGPGGPGGPGSPNGNGECSQFELNLSPATPDINFLIDRSGTMQDPYENTTRWLAVEEALVGPSGVVRSISPDDATLRAATYSWSGAAAEQCPRMDYSTGADPVTAIGNLFGNTSVHTPTAESIDALADTLVAEGFDPQRPKFIILATDGNPDNCSDPDAHNQTSMDMSIAAVQRAYDKGIRTFVISVGTDVVEKAHLQDIADAGQGLPINGPVSAPPPVEASSAAQLAAEFDNIVAGARQCDFAMNGIVTNPGDGQVILNGNALSYPDEYDVIGNVLSIKGNQCDTIKALTTVSLTAEFQCVTDIVEIE